MKWMAWLSHGRDDQAKSRSDFEKEQEKYRDSIHKHESRKKELHEKMEEQTKDEKWKAENTRLCPQCGRCVEKVGGCNLMKCGTDYHGGNVQNGCGAKFKWNTAKPYVPPAVSHLPALEEFVGEAPRLAKGRTHGQYRCDVCFAEIVGIRFSCIHCPMYDVCSGCEGTSHDTTHIFRIIV
jgi:hypothetical protein